MAKYQTEPFIFGFFVNVVLFTFLTLKNYYKFYKVFFWFKTLPKPTIDSKGWIFLFGFTLCLLLWRFNFRQWFRHFYMENLTSFSFMFVTIHSTVCLSIFFSFHSIAMSGLILFPHECHCLLFDKKRTFMKGINFRLLHYLVAVYFFFPFNVPFQICDTNIFYACLIVTQQSFDSIHIVPRRF